MNINKLGRIKITTDLLNLSLDKLADAFAKHKIFTLHIYDDKCLGVKVFRCYSEQFEVVEVGHRIPEYIIKFSYDSGQLKSELIKC